MNPRAFYDTVKAMRAAQIKVDSWYKTREHEKSYNYWSKEKCRLEKVIDNEISRVEGILREKAESEGKTEKIIKALNDKGFGLEPVKDH